MTPAVPVMFWFSVAVVIFLHLIVIYIWDMKRRYEKAYMIALLAVVDVLMATAVLKVLS